MWRWAGVIVGGLGALALAAYLAFRFSPDVQLGVVSAQIERSVPGSSDALLSDDALRVAVCGSGSPLPNPNAAQACYAVIAGGRIFLFDAGAKSFEVITSWRIPLRKIGAVFLTHFHSDHIADIPAVMLGSWVDGRPAPLQIYGGPGVERVVNGFNEAYALDDSYRSAHHGLGFLKPELGVLEARVIAGADGGPLLGTQSTVAYDQDGVKITAFAVDHKPIVPAYGYRIDYKGRSIVISGDTYKTASIALMSQGADLLIHEAMDKEIVGMMRDTALRAGRERIAKIFNDIPDYHATPLDAAQSAQEAGVKLLVLSHLVPPLPHWLGEIVFLRDTGGVSIDTRIAFDGMMIELPIGSDEIVERRVGN